MNQDNRFSLVDTLQDIRAELGTLYVQLEKPTEHQKETFNRINALLLSIDESLAWELYFSDYARKMLEGTLKSDKPV